MIEPKDQIAIGGFQYSYDYLVENIGPGISDTGATVTLDNALGLAAVYEAVSLISGHIAGLPLNVMRRNGDGAEIARDHPVSRLLNESPNDYQTPFTLRETMMLASLMQGNGRARIKRNGLGQPVRLDPLFPPYTYTVIDGGEKWHFTYMHPDDPGFANFNTGNVEILHDMDVLHIPGISTNGYWGLHLLQIARNVLGVGISGQERQGFNFQNAGVPGLLLEVPDPVYLNAQARREFYEEWNAHNRGSRNAGKMRLIREGFKIHNGQVSAQDAELARMTELNSEQVRRLFLLPPSDASAYKSITERNTQYINNCLNRWFKKWTEECRKKLLSDREKLSGAYYFEFDTNSLIKGDPNNLADYTGKLRQQGLISGNEGRIMHGLNPISDPALETYSNPNITTDSAASDDDDSDMGDDEPETPEEDSAIENKALRLHFEHFIAQQIKFLNDVSDTENFTERVEGFYKRLLARMAKLCRELDIDDTIAERHCERSKSLVGESLACATEDNRRVAIASLTADWNSRISELIHV